MQDTKAPPRRLSISRRTTALLVAGAGLLVSGYVFRDALGIGGVAKRTAMDPMTAELLRAAERADICTAANAVGVGLRGEYFSEANLAGTPLLVRVDDVVDFDHVIQHPTAVSTQAARSVKWTGWVKAPITGPYRFHADAPHMKVLVARKVLAGEGAPADARIDLAAGRYYPIEVVVTRFSDSDARIRLEWTAPHGARYVVPRSLLQLPSDTVAKRP